MNNSEMTQHAAGLTFKELLIELIQGAQKMLASPSGQHFPRQGLLVIFPGSTPHGFHHAGGRNQQQHCKSILEGDKFPDIWSDTLISLQNSF